MNYFMSNIKRLISVGVVVLVTGLMVTPLNAATSASFVFDFSDLGDLADGPGFNITAVGPVDDGSGCDAVVMVMVDPTGTPTDVDTVCLVIPAGTGGSDGDYGSINSGYLPVSSPVTYALFDINAADIAALSGLSDSNPAYSAYVIANGELLDEHSTPVDGLPTQPPFSFRPASATPVPTLGESLTWTFSLLLMALGAWQVLRRFPLG